jgi:DNA mismatch repair ATPase MutS
LDVKIHGVSFLDISTGEFLIAEGSLEYIDKLIQGFEPSEIIYQKKMTTLFKENFGEKYYTYKLEDWVFTFDFSQDDALAYPTILADMNTNLSAAQKEVLLWHHKLSHASTSWIQLLMRDKLWLRDKDNSTSSLHSGPFLPCRHKGPVCNINGLKCTACL